MKNIITICAVLIMTVNMFAQAPEKMSYQAVVRDGSNNLVTTAPVGMQISVLQGSMGGTAVYVETQTPTTNANGLVSLEIGGGSPISGIFSAIDWANGPYFIKSETDPSGGTNYTVESISQLQSVPYSLHAKTAETVTGGITETDPIFVASVASGITETDITNWNNKLDSYTETDPLFDASAASGILETDITNWNEKQDAVVAGDNISIVGNTISTSSSGFTHYIGELYGGGIVVAVWKENGVEKGLIASLTDIGTTAPYSSVGTIIGPAAESPFDGQANTAAIIAQGDVSGAAYLCDNYSAGGFDDWYLPAVWEINHFYNAAIELNPILGETNGFKFDYYWSSTEFSGFASRLDFTVGNAFPFAKNSAFRVRAARRF